MPTFLQLYGVLLDRELGSEDRSQRFTTERRKAYVNEGQRWFNEQTSCYVKRTSIAIVDGTQEYDLETAPTDYLWPSKTSASLRRYDGAGSANTDYSYVEGPDLPFKTEEELNQTEPGWRADTAGTPRCWYLREDGGAVYVGLHPTPDVPSAETWTLYWPYVARPEDMTDDSHEPYGNASPRITLRPYHDGILAYATAQSEKLRKNVEGVERQMKVAAAYVAKYRGDIAPKRGTTIRLRHNYRRTFRSDRPPDLTRWP